MTSNHSLSLLFHGNEREAKRLVDARQVKRRFKRLISALIEDLQVRISILNLLKIEL
jgi:hypothetical protein